MSDLYKPDFFQNPSEKKMSFEGIVHAIDAALTGWAEGDDDSNAFFGELVESGGGCLSQFNLIFVVARLTVSVEDMDSPSQQLSYARHLEEDLAWFVDSLQQRPNGSMWKDLLQRVRIIIDEVADDVEEDTSDTENEDPEEMKEAQVEDKSASTSAAQDADNKNEDPGHHEEMKDTSLDASIIDEAADDVKEDKERDVFKNGQKDGDDNNLDTQKKGVSSEKRIGGSINGTDDGKGEAAGSSEEEIEGPAVKKMKQQALVEGDNKDTQVITLQENLKEPSLKVRSTFPFAC